MTAATTLAGEVLIDELLECGLCISSFAKSSRLPINTVSGIVSGEIKIDSEMTA